MLLATYSRIHKRTVQPRLLLTSFLSLFTLVVISHLSLVRPDYHSHFRFKNYFTQLILIPTPKPINMRFTSILAAGAFATMAAAQSKTVSLDPAQQSQADCLADCEPGDVKCQSYCITVSSSNNSTVIYKTLTVPIGSLS
jgi:hypothetical protein